MHREKGIFLRASASSSFARGVDRAPKARCAAIRNVVSSSVLRVFAFS
jgi:hypothetical protein